MKTKRVAALTMVRNDDFYLRKWTAYYGRELGEEHLYIYLDGKDQPPTRLVSSSYGRSGR